MSTANFLGVRIFSKFKVFYNQNVEGCLRSKDILWIATVEEK